MNMEQQGIDQKIKEKGAISLWFVLGSYGSEDRFFYDFFKNPGFLSWTEGTHDLHLFIDGMDEGLLRINTLSALLVNELRIPLLQLLIKYPCLLKSLTLGSNS